MVPDLWFVFAWWLTFFILGISSIPLLCVLFKNFFDIGYGFGKTVGLLFVSYIAFFFAIFRLIPLDRPYLFIILLSYVILNFVIFRKHKKSIVSNVKLNFKTILFQEFLFTAGFISWSFVRAHQPDIRGLEKFMDFGFVNSIINTKYLPPPDMWFAGESINYYWFGHLMVAVATKLSSVPSEVTYNLMLATILGIVLVSSLSIISTLYFTFSKKANPKKILAAGLLSAILLTFGGNFHTPVYLLKEGAQSYWYPDATRFIGYNPVTDDKTIHEFPLYSFVVSDLHAHLINLPLVLLFIGLFWNFVSADEIKKPHLGKKRDEKKSISLRNKYLLCKYGRLLFPGFVLGVMFMTSTWDFANYLLFSGITLSIFNVKKLGNILNYFYEILKVLGILLAISVIVFFPFYINFTSIAQGIDFVHTHTPLWQLAILWGFPVILTVIFSIFLFKSGKYPHKSELFVLSLLISSLVLIVIPEIIYVKDIYIASHYRANTMFKITYQTFVMSYLTSGFVAAYVIDKIKKYSEKIPVFLFFGLVFFVILIYPYFAINSYYQFDTYKGLDGSSWLEKQLPEQYKIIDWLKNNIGKQTIILEAPGDSYTDFNVVSAYTGIPTVSGWFVHEWLWRGDSSFPQERVNDITLIYTSKDSFLTENLLNKYQVEYVIIDSFVRQKFPNVYERKFYRLGQEVFSFGNAKIFRISKN